MHVHTQLIHFPVQQRLTQHCKAVILQLKKKIVLALYTEIFPGLEPAGSWHSRPPHLTDW